MLLCGRQGHPVAYIGHPMYLDEVLPKVVDGTWTPEAAAGLAKVEKEVDAVFGALNGEPEAALKAVAEFEKNHPKLADIPYFNGPKISAMLKAKKTAEARTFAEKLIAKAMKTDDSAVLRSVSVALRSRSAGTTKSWRHCRSRRLRDAQDQRREGSGRPLLCRRGALRSGRQGQSQGVRGPGRGRGRE